ncbi:E3 ubiquitin-protein ligase TRIM17-like [Saccostrea echinata]|uniref:E3 ubiquitin-protein ligase TRIM17-like n=1 Tax=Saccostrea echinata TaxID=191078 RepID=UPI002A8413E6|nr:E3 ubiquitin-protein ligase TRIM17-like [Saccostrea echinata]
MDAKFCAQDIIRCDLCKDRVVQMHCNLCPMNLCKDCVVEHISDVSKKHDVVPLALRRSKLVYPQCLTHSEENCEMHCEDCNILACSKCVISEKHKRHHFRCLQDLMNSKKESIEKERKRLKETVKSTFEDIATDIETQLAEIDGKYEKLASEVTTHGEEWHQEIDKVIQKNKEEINKMRNQHRDALNKHLNNIKKLVVDIKQSILETEDILQSIEVIKSLSYEINSEKFTKLPSKLIVMFPVFTGNNNQDQCSQLFGSLSPLSLIIEEHGYTMKTPDAVFCPPVKPLLDEPELITTIDTGSDRLFSVACLSDQEIWARGGDKIMKLYNLQGKLLKSIQTKSGNIPYDIAVTRSGDLVHTDPISRTVNIVKNKQIQEVIRLQGWKPYYVCSTSSDDLLVTMYSGENEHSKVVRCSGYTEKQTLQFDDKGKPLYPSGYLKCISENRNLDICVADRDAHAVVVVNQAGKLRFRYTGHPSTNKKSFYHFFNKKGSSNFDPRGITTDSQSQILTADGDNNCIHILDQDGQFLRYIDNCDLQSPFGLCVDTKDNLFVAEFRGRVKEIKYM